MTLQSSPPRWTALSLIHIYAEDIAAVDAGDVRDERLAAGGDDDPVAVGENGVVGGKLRVLVDLNAELPEPVSYTHLSFRAKFSSVKTAMRVAASALSGSYCG